MACSLPYIAREWGSLGAQLAAAAAAVVAAVVVVVLAVGCCFVAIAAVVGALVLKAVAGAARVAANEAVVAGGSPGSHAGSQDAHTRHNTHCCSGVAAGSPACEQAVGSVCVCVCLQLQEDKGKPCQCTQPQVHRHIISPHAHHTEGRPCGAEDHQVLYMSNIFFWGEEGA